MLRPDKALENDGNVIASAVGEEATAVTMPQPREAESVQETLARVAGLADGRTVAPAVQRPELLAAAVKPAAKTMAAETIAETTTAETERAAAAEPEAVTAADAIADGVSAQRTAAESSQPAAEPAANTAGERPATRSKTGVSARTAYYANRSRPISLRAGKPRCRPLRPAACREPPAGTAPHRGCTLR